MRSQTYPNEWDGIVTSSTRERRGPRCHSPRPAELNVDRTLRAIHSSACACNHVTRGMCGVYVCVITGRESVVSRWGASGMRRVRSSSHTCEKMASVAHSRSEGSIACQRSRTPLISSFVVTMRGRQHCLRVLGLRADQLNDLLIRGDTHRLGDA